MPKAIKIKLNQNSEYPIEATLGDGSPGTRTYLWSIEDAEKMIADMQEAIRVEQTDGMNNRRWAREKFNEREDM